MSTCAAGCINLEDHMLSEISQTQKGRCVIPLLGGSENGALPAPGGGGRGVHV